MSKNRASIVFMIILIIVGVFYVIEANSLPSGPKDVVTSGFFPTIVGVAMIILSSAGIFKTLKKMKNNPDEEVLLYIPNLKQIIVTLSGLIVYTISWTITNQFYICSFGLLVFLILYYTPKESMKKAIPLTLVISLTTIVSIYIIFYKIMAIRF